uniref:Reverse transcriptase domain-containing protein n=1 Tax=Cannabis sativa TaxID=3483 RepID=A0A803PZ52_CANSA
MGGRLLPFLKFVMRFELILITCSSLKLSGDKAPGLDGLNPAFYQKNWSIIGPDLTTAILDILNGNADFSSINATLIVLIPKKTNASTLKDFRPISLRSTVYKIVAKAIANRLKFVLGDLISSNQGVFLSERIIFDNIYIAQEIVHAIKHRKHGKLGWVGLKLDMEKAFDRVEWSFLMAILHRFQFPSHFINLIYQCVSSTSIRFSINGQITDPILPSRGIRQGDPLSPYLFLLCSEGLTAALRIQENLGLFKGISIARTAPAVSHLLFADDTLIFTTASFASCSKIHWKAWNNLCTSKFFGGLGFRSLVHHNQAMIAKQAWRVLSNPNSTLAAILKAKYFKHTGFYEARLGHSPSFTWSSLLWGRDLLSQVTHALLDCSSAAKIWKASPLKHFYVTHRHVDIKEFLISGYSHLNKEDLTLLLTTVWAIWNLRNKKLFANLNMSSADVIDWINSYLSDYNAAQLNMRKLSPSQILHVHGQQKQVNPGYYQLNTDAALCSSQGKLGFGAVINDWHGRIVAGLSIPSAGDLFPLMAEALALRASLNWCYHIRILIAVIETDSKLLVDRIYGRKRDLSVLSDVVEDIRSSLSLFPNASLHHVNRKNNNNAHLLAKKALGLDKELSWNGSVPVV